MGKILLSVTGCRKGHSDPLWTGSNIYMPKKFFGWQHEGVTNRYGILDIWGEWKPCFSNTL